MHLNTGPLAFLTITLYRERLYGVTLAGGELYPLYIYAPLYHARSENPPVGIPMLRSWPPYIAVFVSTYQPLPVVVADIAHFVAVNTDSPSLTALAEELPQFFLPRILQGDLDVQARSSVEASAESVGPYERSWPQTTYRGYPLYYARTGIRENELADHPDLFIPATLSLEPRGSDPASVGGPGDLTWPPPGFGP